MLAVYTSSSFFSSSAMELAAGETENPDIWFDAIDRVEMDKSWFDHDAADELWFDACAEDQSENDAAASKAETMIPFTEDCRRCIKELIRYLGEVKEREFLFAGISQLIPRLPADLMCTAYSLYVAVTERKDIDLAVLSTLGLASSHLLDDGNAIASMARYVRETLREYVGQSDWAQYLNQEESETSTYMFTALAVLAIVARHWMTDDGAPQRRLLRVPAFLANFLVRVNSYWGYLGRLAQHAAQTCHFTLSNEAGHHRYRCLEEWPAATTETPKTTMPPSVWICTKTDADVALAALEKRCAFSRYPALPHHFPDRTHTIRSVPLGTSAAVEIPGNEVVQPLMVAAAASTVAAARHAGWNNGVVRATALTFAGTVACVGGKLIRDAILSRYQDGGYGHALPTPQAVTDGDDTSIADGDASASALMQSTPTLPTSIPPLFFRNRLIGYLHTIHPFPSHQTSDLELARASLRVLREDEKHMAVLAHIALYGTGLFGEKHDEYLDPSVQQLLVADLLARLLFEHRSLEEYILVEFANNRRISIEDFHQKITGWSLGREDDGGALKRFFHEKFLFPMMPVLGLDFQNAPLNDGKRFLLVGSATWFFIYMGAQFMSSSADPENESDAEEMMLFGGAIFNMLKKGTLIDGSVQVLAPGIRLAVLFLYPEWTPETLPDLPELQTLICNAFTKKMAEDSSVIEQLYAAKEQLDKANKASWFSRMKIAEELLLKHCERLDPVLYADVDKNSGNNQRTDIDIAKVSIGHGQTPLSFFMDRKTHLKCINKKKQVIKIPTANHRYKMAIADFVNALRNATNASLSQLFLTSDEYRKDFSYDDYKFIHQSALTAVNVLISRERDIREKLAFGSHVERWRPKPEYLFFNATQGEETRIYVLNRSVNAYWISKLNTSRLLDELRPLFDAWPPSTLNTIHAEISNTQDSVKKAEVEPISMFIERLVEEKFRDAETLLYKAGYDAPFSDLVYELLKDIFIPFYSCVTSLKKGDADDAVVSCVLDGAFVLGPLLKGGKTIVGQMVKLTGKRIYIQLISAPNFVPLLKLTIRKTVTLKQLARQPEMNRDGAVAAAAKSALHLVVETLDPGIVVLVEVKKTLTEFGKIFIGGNVLLALSHASKNWKSLIEASIRVKSLTGARKLFVPMSRGTNWGADFDKEFNRSELQLGLDSQKGDSFLSLVSINDGYYNIFRIDKAEISFLASETGEVSHLGTKVYAMLGANSQAGVFVKYVCAQPVSTVCELSPWLPPEIKAAAFKPTKTETGEGGTVWTFEDTKHFSRSFVYPDHQCEIIQDGYVQSKLCEIVEVDGVQYIFDPYDPYLRPLHGGDHASIVARQKQNPFIDFERNFAGEIVIFFSPHASGNSRYFFSLNEKYQLQSGHCHNSKKIFLTPANSLVARIGNNCFPLQLAPIRNRFFIHSHYLMQPSLTMGWSAKDAVLKFSKPYLGESSIHVGISLEDFISREKSHCEGNAINKLAMELVSGAIFYKGDVWLQVLHSSYRLGAWREGLCPLYCHNDDRIAAWLRYDLFTESFDLVHEGDDWEQAKKKQRDSIFEELVRENFSKRKWYDIEQLSMLTDQVASKRLMLRLHQAAFLQSMNDVDRMVLLSLPAAYLRSWKLHVDAVPLVLEYPALALGLSQFRQMASSVDGVTPNQLSLLSQMSLKNDLIGNYSLPGKIIPGGDGEHDAIWLQSGAVPILLKRYQLNFYGEHITSSEGRFMWVPEINCAPIVSLTQFMPPTRSQPLPLTNIYRNEVWVAHAEWGLVALQRDEKASKIEYVLVSPDANWIGLIDNVEYLTLFSMRNLTDSPGVDAEVKVNSTRSLRLPIELRRLDFSLCFINNDGEFHYPAQLSWRRLSDNQLLWNAPLNFQPSFITPDQRFLGFENSAGSGGLIYDRHRQKAIFLRHPSSPQAWSTISAVAFSPLNALVALAFNDGQVFLYDLTGDTTEIKRDPISSAKLKELFYADDKSTFPFKQTIVMRFTGVFRYLTIIYDMGLFSLNKAFDSKNFVYEIYGFLPPESPAQDDG